MMTKTSAQRASTAPFIRIEPLRGWIAVNLGELWAYRELLFFLAWRDVKVRYKQTVLGFAWAVIQPIATMVVFSLFFGRLAKIPSEGLPYPIFSYAALLPWNLFAHAMANSSNSLVSSANLIKKVYFPRLAIPLATVVSGLVDFMIAFLVLIGLMFYYSVTPTVNVIWLPAFLLLALVTALGVGFWLSALNVQYRDVRYTLPFLTQIWMFSSPIVYPSSLVPEHWRLIYGINPMVGVVDGFRWALLGTHTQPGPMIGISVLCALAIFIGGLFYFRRMEKSFADLA